MSQDAAGFSVRIFLPTGDPDGIRIVEKSNWTGQGLVFPRSLFQAARLRQEIRRAGVYVLWGPGDEGDLPGVYVGEGDDLLPRLASHVRTKDFWTHAAAFTSKDQSLNKAHAKYLEARLHERAGAAKRCALLNEQVPQPPALTEMDAADAESFLADMLLCLPVVGVTFFDQPRVKSTEHPAFILRAKGIEARGLDGPEGFVVLEGSGAVRDEVPSLQAFVSSQRRSLREIGVLVESGDTLRVSQDYSFNSPSTAASVLLGRNTNGRSEWKDATGRSLKEVQEAAADGE